MQTVEQARREEKTFKVKESHKISIIDEIANLKRMYSSNLIQQAEKSNSGVSGRSSFYAKLQEINDRKVKQ